MAVEITEGFVWQNIPPRARDSHKGTFGSVLAVAGSASYRGAAALAVEGALRTGAGIVTLASVEPVLAAVAARLPECCLCPCKEGAQGGIAPENVPLLRRQKATVLLLGPGGGLLQQAGHIAPELIGCRFPAGVLPVLKNLMQRDFMPLFEPGAQTALYGPVQWSGRLRTLLGMMQSAESEPESPGMIYLALILHYVEQECRSERQDIRPRNETVEQICAYLAANYRQKFSLTEVAAQFYLSPYYLSRLFRRVTGQSIVDYINNRRIEAAQKLLETTELSISAVA